MLYVWGKKPTEGQGEDPMDGSPGLGAGDIDLVYNCGDISTIVATEVVCVKEPSVVISGSNIMGDRGDAQAPRMLWTPVSFCPKDGSEYPLPWTVTATESPNILFSRGSTKNQQIASSDALKALRWPSGVTVKLLDGPSRIPVVKVVGGTIEISGVQQADKIVFQDPNDPDVRDQVSVVKGLTWNDLQRFGNNLSVGDGITGVAAKNLIDSIKFALNPSNDPNGKGVPCALYIGYNQKESDHDLTRGDLYHCHFVFSDSGEQRARADDTAFDKTIDAANTQISQQGRNLQSGRKAISDIYATIKVSCSSYVASLFANTPKCLYYHTREPDNSDGKINDEHRFIETPWGGSPFVDPNKENPKGAGQISFFVDHTGTIRVYPSDVDTEALLAAQVDDAFAN